MVWWVDVGVFEGGTPWTSGSVQPLGFTSKKLLVWRCFLRYYLTDKFVSDCYVCSKSFSVFSWNPSFLYSSHLRMTWYFPHRWIQELCLLSTLVIYGSLYLLNLYVNLPLFSIHHQNNAKYALLYAFRYSQLSSKWLPVVHDKVVAYRRLSSMGKKKKNISNFCPKKRSWSFKKFK